jgi:O-antigen ligase
MVAVAAHLSPSATAKAGLLAGAGAWILSYTLPRIAAACFSAGWSVAALACIPLSHMIHRYGLYDLDWINASLRHRMMIWSASAEWYWQHPIIGVGVGGARKLNLNDALQLTAKGIEGQPLNWHAHNIFVQAWFEAGAIGGLLLCLLGLVVLRAIFRLPGTVRPFAVATFASIFVIGLTGFSLWAAWYLAGYGLASLCILLAVFISRDEAPLPGPAAG